MEDHPRANLRSYGINSKIWKVLAGSNFNIPSVGEHVYYFFEGHAEHSTSPPFFSPSVHERPMILCRVLDVRFLVHPETDELFLGIKLEPIGNDAREEIEPARDGNLDMFVASTKRLTLSDANNGGGFSVPRRCAESVFPALDYKDDPPVQIVSFRDVSGTYWNFRHIYRGTPRRHLLTTGWSRFNNSKLLVANDCLTFMRNRITNDCYIGVRRVTPFNADHEPTQEGWTPALEGVSSRRYLGKVLPDSVAEAAALAAANMPFEVAYYPGAGRSEFLVNSQLVRNSLSFQWKNGLKVKIGVQPQNSSAGMQIYHGRVISLRAPSPWRMLLVEWENAPEDIQREVSPWQVSHMYHIPSPNLFYRTPDHFHSAWFDPQNSRRRTSLNNSGVNGASSSQYMSHAGNGIQGARQQDLQLLTMPTLPNLISQGPESVPTGLNPSSSSHATRQKDQQLRTIPTLPNIKGPGHKEVPPGSNISSSSSHSTLETVSSESKNTTSTSEAILESPPIVKESSKEDHIGNSAYSLKLFGKIINVKVPNL